MRYKVLLRDTQEDANRVLYDRRGQRHEAQSLDGFGVVVTPDGEVAFWDDSAGWAIEKDQNKYQIIWMPQEDP